jgi:manganese/zinc/iron transport system permease protein
MLPLQIEIQVIAVLVAAACALPGVFLILRQMAMLSDAISHSVLLGIVLAYLIVFDINSPVLIIGAALSGLVTVYLVELLLKTSLVKEDAAIGLVFPALFSIAVIIITYRLGNVHLDQDVVLLGELAFAPFNRAEILGIDLPKGIWVMGTILLINVGLIALSFKELKLSSFDPALAAALGFSPVLLHYGLMSIVSVTVVGAFDHVGAILVVALMVAPPATAYLLTNNLTRMLILSVLIGAASAISGYWIALEVNTNIAGAMAVMTGVFFLLALVFAPEHGLLARQIEHHRRQRRFAVEMLIVHLSRHEGQPDEEEESSVAHLTGELNWTADYARQAMQRASRQGLVTRSNGHLQLTESGRAIAQKALRR